MIKRDFANRNIFIIIENCFYSDIAKYNQFLKQSSANHDYRFAHSETNENWTIEICKIVCDMHDDFIYWAKASKLNYNTGNHNGTTGKPIDGFILIA